jgi:hypothetical protein
MGVFPEAFVPVGDDALTKVRSLILQDRLIPYLGPGLLSLGGAAVPDSPEAVAAGLHRLAPTPKRIRDSMWSVAQYIESKRHRRTLTKFMSELFAAPCQPNALQHWLAGLPLAMVVDAWYDGAMAAALRAASRDDFVEIQGAPRIQLSYNGWTRTYDHAGAPLATPPWPGTPTSPRTLLYTPHGSARPAHNFLIADSDYVEVLTEIDIQTPIPDEVKARRASRGFVFIGCRFHDQMLRTYARQVMKRSAGPHFAIVNTETLTRNEAKFLVDNAIAPIAAPLDEVATALIG